MQHFISRLVLSLLTLAFLLIGETLFFSPSVTHAGVVDLSCTGSSSLLYSPALTFSPKSITATDQGTLNSCLASTNPAISSGSYTSSGSGRLACVFSSHLRRSATYHWKNGSSSTVSYLSSITTNRAGISVITDTGTVTAGPFIGDSAVQTNTFTPAGLPACPTSTGTSIPGNSLALTLTHP
jgi:hypothetical protein